MTCVLSLSERGTFRKYKVGAVSISGGKRWETADDFHPSLL
jgi:hypothetical protein